MGSIWFVLGFVSIYSAFFGMKKTDEDQNGIVWGVMSFIVILCYHALAAAVFNLIKLPINLWSIGCANILGSLILWRTILKDKLIQKYFWRKKDIIAVVILLLPVLAVSINQFGIGLNINYAVADGATHYRLALEVLLEHRVRGMFFAPLNNALFLEIFSPFVKSTRLFHVFVLSDILMNYLAGIVFYSVIADKIDSKWEWGVALIIALFYWLGYPRNNLLYGFNYLGISIILILFVAWIVLVYLENKMNKDISIVLISLGCYSIGICYSLFAPVVFCSICAAISIQIWRRREKGNNNWIKRFIIDNLKIFLIPCIVIFIYSFVGFFGIQGSGEAIGSSISTEGAIYRDLFSNFIFWIPFAVLGIYKMIKDKINDSMLFYAVFLAVFLFILGLGGMRLKVSSYYYYKNYFFVSIIIFYFSYIGIKFLMKNNKEYVFVSLGLLVILGAMTIFSIEERIQRRNILFAPVSKSQYYFDIYVINNQIENSLTDYSREKLELYEYCSDHFPKSSYDSVVVCASIVDNNIYKGVVQRLKEEESFCFKRWTEEEKRELSKENESYEIQFQRMQKLSTLQDEMPFLYVYTTKEDYEEFNKFKGNDVDILYENSEGFVGMLKNCKEG